MAVPFQHCSRHVTHDGEHSALGNTGLCQLGSRCVSQVMQSAVNPAALAQRVPCACQITNRLCRIEWTQFAFLSLSCAARENIPLRPNLANFALVPGSMLCQDSRHVLI